jgi:anti-sigma factor RsiW
VAQHSNRHLTTTQLSAYLDKELGSDELALYDAHLQTCMICQGTLADLRLTSVLLRGMSQVEVPRSFVLPTTIAVLPQTSSGEEQHARQPARSRHIWKHAFGTFSSLAAILGLLLILFGGLSALPHNLGVSMSTTAGGSSGNSAPQTRAAPTQSPAATSGRISPNVQSTQQAQPTPTPGDIQATPTEGPQPQPTSIGQQSGPPPLLDLGRTEGRLAIGVLLLALGVLGILLTRRIGRAPNR